MTDREKDLVRIKANWRKLVRQGQLDTALGAYMKKHFRKDVKESKAARSKNDELVSIFDGKVPDFKGGEK